MNKYDNLYFAANLLIDASEETQKKYPELKQNMGSMVYHAKEFCTIKFCTSRRSGHTSYIHKLAEERFNNKVILLFNTWELSNCYKECFFGYNEPPFNILSTSSNFRGIELDDIEAIIIDTAYSLSKQKIDEIYASFSCGTRNEKPFFFIFVQ